MTSGDDMQKQSFADVSRNRRSYAKFIGKHLWQSLFFNKVAKNIIGINLQRKF